MLSGLTLYTTQLMLQGLSPWVICVFLLSPPTTLALVLLLRNFTIPLVPSVKRNLEEEKSLASSPLSLILCCQSSSCEKRLSERPLLRPLRESLGSLGRGRGGGERVDFLSVLGSNHHAFVIINLRLGVVLPF